MIEFFKDGDGNYIYYAESSKKARLHQQDLILNGAIAFNTWETSTLPEPQTLELVDRGEVPIYMKGIEDPDSTITVEEYQAKLTSFEALTNPTIQETVEYEVWLRTWEEVTEEQEVRTNVPFKVTDFVYPSDIRLKPMRHLGDPLDATHFTINPERIAVAKARELCEDTGLKKAEDRYCRKINTYCLDDSMYDWSLEGEHIGRKFDLDSTFIGEYSECIVEIERIEASVVKAFDDWGMAYLRPKHITVRKILTGLQAIKRSLEFIQPKIKTVGYHSSAIKEMDELVAMVKEAAKEQYDESN